MNWIILLLCLLVSTSCRRHEDQRASPPAYGVSRLDGGVALEEVRRFVDLGAKVAGSEESRRAADYLEQRAGELGLTVERQVFMDAVPGGSNTFINIIATIPGKRPGTVILGAHYDTKSGIESFVGANDSGSGVGLLLALVPILKAGAVNAPTVQLAFLDGEECRVEYGPHDGLHGSRHLAGALVASGRSREVAGFILLDMIGDRDLTVQIPRNGTPDLMERVFKAAEEAGVRSRFTLFRGRVLDDHQPFLDAGIPAVDLIDFEYGSAPGLNDYWHTSADTMDKLSGASLELVGQVVLRVLNGF